MRVRSAVSPRPEVAAQAPPATGGLRRKVLQQADGPTPAYVTVVVEIEVGAGATVARHPHPGIGSSYMIEAPANCL